MKSFMKLDEIKKSQLADVKGGALPGPTAGIVAEPDPIPAGVAPYPWPKPIGIFPRPTGVIAYPKDEIL